MGTYEKEATPDKPKGRNLRVTIGLALGCLAVIAILFATKIVARGSTPGQQFYQAIISGKLSVPDLQLASIAPRQEWVTPPPNALAGLRLHLGNYSLVIPNGARCVTLPFSDNSGWAGPAKAKTIEGVTYLIPSLRGGDTVWEPGNYIEQPRVYTPVPAGLIEIGDGVGGWFVIPAKAASIKIRLRPGVGSSLNIGLIASYRAAWVQWIPVDQGTAPRNWLAEILRGRWPIKDLSKPLQRVLVACGVKFQVAKGMIKNVIRQQLAVHTDFQLLRSELMVTTAKIKKQLNVHKALWMALELQLLLYENPNQRIVWVHLDHGRLLCFACGSHGTRAWVFNSAGMLTGEGSMGNSGGTYGGIRWRSWVRLLKSVAIPFFSQPPPPWYVQHER